MTISADACRSTAGSETLTGAHPGDRLVGILPVTESFSAGEYAGRRPRGDRRRAGGRAAPDRGRRHRPVPPGGAHRPRAAPAAAAGAAGEHRARWTTEGAEALHAELAERAPEAAAAVPASDRTRLVRALELLEMGEEPAPAGDDSRLWTARLRHPTLLCGLTMDREALYRAIDARVEAMVEAGAAEEVRARRRRRARAPPRARPWASTSCCAATARRWRAPPAGWPSASSPGCAGWSPSCVLDATGREPADLARGIVRRLESCDICHLRV